MALVERWSELGVASVLAHRATADPQRTFLLHDARRITYGEIDQEAEALAAAFHNLGVERGDRVALVLPPCPEFVASMLAAARLGATVVPLDPLLTAGELQYMLRHSEAVAAVTIETFQGIQFLELFEDLLAQLPELQYLVTVGEEDLWYDDRIFQYEDVVSAGQGRDYPVEEAESPDATFAVLYTSGTTGKPKGVQVTHRNVVAAAAGTVERLGIGPDDRLVGVNSLAHAFGIGPGIMGTMLAGASIVLDDDLDPARALDLIETHRATVEYATPALVAQQLREMASSARDTSSLRLVMVAGGPIPAGVAEQAEAVLGAKVVLGYSLTEGASTVTVSSPEDDASVRHLTAGAPLPGVELRVMEKGETLPVESVGEVYMRGPTLMEAYYRKPRETASRRTEDGFFRTGDLGMLDERGHLHLVGRRDAVIIRRGFNLYPREVEDRLHAHPAVLEAAVVGVPDELLGEATCASIVLEEGALVTDEEIRDWCRASLAEPKVPDLVRFVDVLPRSASGEVRRPELRREAMSMLTTSEED